MAPASSMRTMIVHIKKVSVVLCIAVKQQHLQACADGSTSAFMTSPVVTDNPLLYLLLGRKPRPRGRRPLHAQAVHRGWAHITLGWRQEYSKDDPVSN